MKTNAMAHFQPMIPAWAVVPVTAGLFLVGFLGGLWLAWAAALTAKTATFIAILALVAVACVAWYASRALGDRRWRAALDRYAERELAKGEARSWRRGRRPGVLERNAAAP